MAYAVRKADNRLHVIAQNLRSLRPADISTWANTHPLLTAKSDRILLSKITYLRSLDKRNLGGCYASNRNLAKRCGLSVRTVQRSIKRMERLGIITVTEQWTGGVPGTGRQTSNLIEIVGFPVHLLADF